MTDLFPESGTGSGGVLDGGFIGGSVEEKDVGGFLEPENFALRRPVRELGQLHTRDPNQVQRTSKNLESRHKKS